MPETTSSEECERNHREGMKNLEIERGHLVEAKQLVNLDPLDTVLIDTFELLIDKISEAQQRGPEDVFKAALTAAGVVEAKRFLIENILEAVKRGDSLNRVMKRFQDLGVLPESPTPKPQESMPVGIGAALVHRLRIWKAAAMDVAQIGINAFMSAAKWVEIEPEVSFCGPVPIPCLTIKGKGKNVHELIEAIRKGSLETWE